MVFYLAKPHFAQYTFFSTGRWPQTTIIMLINDNSFLSIVRSLAAGLVGLTLCAACSSAPKELRLESNSATITGELGEYVEVVPGTYTVSASHENIMVLETRVKFRVKKALPANKDVESLSMDVLTSDAMPIPGLDKFKLQGYLSSGLDPLRAALKTGTGEVILPLYMDGNRDAALAAVETHQTDAKKFAVTGALNEKEKSEAAGSSSTAQHNSNPKDCNQFLTNLETVVASYSSLATKMSKNPLDLTMMSEFTDIATKAQEMQQDKPDACEADAAFIKRYTQIMTNMTKAAAIQTAGMAKQTASAVELISKMKQ